jgi:preprotein translocase subunit SecE
MKKSLFKTTLSVLVFSAVLTGRAWAAAASARLLR